MIVVAKLHFFHGHRIVFIDNGNDARFQQHLEGMLGIDIALAIGQVFMGKQDLSDIFFEP